MKTKKMTILCLIIAGLFTYGKYFVATTELQKMDYGITAMLWIILGMVVLKNENTKQ